MPLQAELLSRTEQLHQVKDIREDPALAQIGHLVHSLVYDETPKHECSYWDSTSASLLVALLIHVHCCEGEKTLRRAAELLSASGPVDIVELLLESRSADENAQILVAREARALLSMTERVRSCVVACAMGHLESWEDRGIGAGSPGRAFVLGHLAASLSQHAPAAA
jgi:type IV secretory pathway TraG/TraD family ATPase VirD4